METVRVHLGTRSYDIVICSGSLADAGNWLAGFSLPPKVLIVADENTASLFGGVVADSLRVAGFLPVLAAVPPGENSKSLQMADRLFEAAIRHGLDRSSAVVALGGGVVGDLAGFVAATYLRGVPFLQVPTTLLSQVDSSVGGKVAVNHSLGKNLIGAFYQPLGVLIDPETLGSLPEREFASGMAEVIKYGLIMDAEFLAELKTDALAIMSRTPEYLERIVARCCWRKAEVVERDENDTGERMLLNFGHTAGHAIEAAGRYERFTHGEGVALGMLVATRLSEREKTLPCGAAEELRSLLETYGLPVRATGLGTNELLRYMGTDKKREKGEIRWVLLDRPGHAYLRSGVSADFVKDSLQVILHVE